MRRSLRRTLLWWIAGVHVLAALVTAAATQWSATRLDNAFLDGQMEALAGSYVDAGAPSAPEPPNEYGIRHWGALIVQLWDREGRLVADAWPRAGIGLQHGAGFHDVHNDDAHWRVYTAVSERRIVQVIQSGAFRRTEVGRRALYAGLTVLGLFPVSLALIWIAVRLALRPLDALAKRVAAEDERSFSALPLEGVPAEVRPFAGAINSLVLRLQALLAQQRRFTQDAAHELRTPIGALQLQVDNLRQDPTGVALGARLDQLEAGVQRAGHLVSQLLQLARNDAAEGQAPAQPIDLLDLLRQSVGDLIPLAASRRIEIGVTAALQPRLRGDAGALRSLFDNLIDNAVRYGRVGGTVDIRVHEADGGPVVDVVDEGPGIAPEALERVFDRFFRTRQDKGGSGLGLAIARAAAERHGLAIVLVNRGDGEGLVARVRLPRETSPAGAAPSAAMPIAAHPSGIHA